MGNFYSNYPRIPIPHKKNSNKPTITVNQKLLSKIVNSSPPPTVAENERTSSDENCSSPNKYTNMSSGDIADSFRVEKKVKILKESIPVEKTLVRNICCQNRHLEQHNSKNITKLATKLRPELTFQLPKGYNERLKSTYPLGLRKSSDNQFVITFHFGDDHKFSWQLFLEYFNLNMQEMNAFDYKQWCVDHCMLNSITLYDKLVINCKTRCPRVIKCARNRFQVNINISDRFPIPFSGWFRAVEIKQSNKKLVYFAFIHIKKALINARVPIHALNERRSSFVV